MSPLGYYGGTTVVHIVPPRVATMVSGKPRGKQPRERHTQRKPGSGYYIIRPRFFWLSLEVISQETRIHPHTGQPAALPNAILHCAHSAARRIISKLPLFTGEDSKVTLFRVTRESEIFGQSKIVKNYLREIGSEMNKIDNARVHGLKKVVCFWKPSFPP